MCHHLNGRLLMAFSILLLSLPAGSSHAQTANRHISLDNGKRATELHCPAKAPAGQRRVAPAEALEPPDAEELDQIGALLDTMRRHSPRLDEPGLIPRRIAIWGDSHLAAGSFSAELRRVLGAQGSVPRPSYLPLTMGRAGVNLPLRGFCMDGWKSELAYSSRTERLATGIGMNALQGEPGAYLWLDLRNAAGDAEIESVDLFFNASSAASAVVSADGGPEARVVLDADNAFGRVRISGNAGSVSVLKLRAQSALTLHAVKLNYREPPVAVLDTFAIPGATMRAWQQLDAVFFARYFDQSSYDMVMLEFGTNEGNARPFDAQAYAQMLDAGLRQFRLVFPTARCVLIAPGDRGTLLPKSRKKGARAGAADSSGLSANLLRFSAIHEKIFQLQQQAGSRHGCLAWSMQNAMGGPGSAYRWMLADPPLMARDLIHFTPPGYQRLAQELADALGWKSGLPPLPGAPSSEAR